MNKLDQIATKIIKEQELIIGPIAWEEARKVKGLNVVDSEKGEVTVENSNTQVIDMLINQYEHIFGPASKEVCKDAVATLLVDLSPSDIPLSLR